MARLPVRCVDLVESVTDWMEGGLNEDQRLQIEEHLVICPNCTEYVRQLRAMAAGLRELAPPGAPPPSARVALLAEFRRRRESDT